MMMEGGMDGGLAGCLGVVTVIGFTIIGTAMAIDGCQNSSEEDRSAQHQVQDLYEVRGILRHHSLTELDDGSMNLCVAVQDGPTIETYCNTSDNFDGRGLRFTRDNMGRINFDLESMPGTEVRLGVHKGAGRFYRINFDNGNSYDTRHH